MADRVQCKPRKILFLSGGAHAALDAAGSVAAGGAELQVALMAKALVSLGHEVVLAAPSTAPPDGSSLSGVRIRHAGRFDTGRAGDTLLALWPILRVVRSEQPDVVVIYGWTTWLSGLCALRFLLPGTRIAFVCALDGEVNGRFRKAHPIRGRLFDWGLRAADARLAITGAQAEGFRRRGLSCKVTRLLLQNPDHSPAGEKGVDLLWVARGHPVKRPMLFLDLAAGLPGIRCRMICTPQDQTLWKAVRDRAAGLPNVEFLGGVPYREVQGHFDAARVFVNTSEDEGVPNTFLHAAQGHCAVASLLSDPDGMFQKFGGGFSAGGDTAMLAARVADLLADPDALDRARQGAQKFLAEWHDNARNVRAFLEGLPA